MRLRAKPGHVLAALAAFVVTVPGCGSSNIIPAGGKVVFPDGTPLTGGYVNTQPARLDQPSARGEIQSDGTFRLGTFADHDGAIEGEHQVLIVPPEAARVDEHNPHPQSIHPDYRKFETSGLTITVTRDRKKNEFILTIRRPDPAPGK